MEQTGSTLAKEMQQWTEREKHFVSMGLLTPEKIESDIWQKDKLAYFNLLAAKHSDSKNLNERMSRRVLELEKRELERKLYPHVIVRLIVRLLDSVTLKGLVRQDIKETDGRIIDIGREMRAAGFEKLVPKMEQQLKQGNRDFSLPVSFGVSETERMDYLLRFKTGLDGQCHFGSYKATLVTQDNSSGQKWQVFENETGKSFSRDQAYHLLSGRSIQDGSGGWQKLDFNDRDAGGSFRLKHFTDTYVLDLSKALAKLPLAESEAAKGKGLLINRLAGGQRVSVLLHVDGKDERYSLEANPQKKEVSIFDPSGRRVAPEQLQAEQGHGNRASNVVNLVPKKEVNAAENKTNVRKLEQRKERQQTKRSCKAIRH